MIFFIKLRSCSGAVTALSVVIAFVALGCRGDSGTSQSGCLIISDCKGIDHVLCGGGWQCIEGWCVCGGNSDDVISDGAEPDGDDVVWDGSESDGDMDITCIQNCGDRECGRDPACGKQSCGSCDDGYFCDDGKCVAVKPPVCQFEMLAGGVQLDDNGEITPMDENDNGYITFTNDSYDPTVGGGIASQLWSVEQPSDSVSLFIPAATYENPKFSPHIVGAYNFCLEVFNGDGYSDKCCKTVNVVSPPGCHIELTWNTPADADQTDECFMKRDCGADMDLHMVHPLATGKTRDPETGAPFGFFDMTYDCYWMIPHPTWDLENAGDPQHQPNLDRDDPDGAGPENWTYTIPDPEYSTTAPACYRVGVHYYDDHSFGKSYPTVKVFINNSTPVYEKTLTSGMSMLDMWDVGRVCCSNQDTPFVERVKTDGTPFVVHNYVDESVQ